MKKKSTADVVVPKLLLDQIIGQERSVELIRKAAIQKRNVLLVGLLGIGKSMLALAMSCINAGPVHAESLKGKYLLHIPFLGHVKLFFFDDLPRLLRG